jgi:glycine cleavage system H protein
MATVRFTREHEWIRIDGDTGTVGITDYAQEHLGDIVFVDLPEIGARFKQGEEIAVVESVKAASEVYAPVGGEVIEVNGTLVDDPGRINADAMGDGWFFKIRVTNLEECDKLFDLSSYRDYLKTLE